MSNSRQAIKKGKLFNVQCRVHACIHAAAQTGSTNPPDGRTSTPSRSKAGHSIFHLCLLVSHSSRVPSTWHPYSVDRTAVRSRHGRETFTSREAAEILVRHKLATLGVEYDQTAEVGCMAAQSVLWHAITKYAGVCELIGKPDDVERCLNKLSNSTLTASRLTNIGAPNHLIIVGCDGTMQLTKLDSIDWHRPPSQRRQTIHLPDLARKLVVGTQRPLFHLNVSNRNSLEIVRKLSKRSINPIDLQLH